MNDQPTNLDEAKDSFARQARELLDDLPGEDFDRVIRFTLAGAAGALLQAMLFATRGMSNEQTQVHAMRSHGQRWAETAAKLDELSGKASPAARHAVSTRSAALQAESEKLFASADRMQAEIDAEAEKHA